MTEPTYKYQVLVLSLADPWSQPIKCQTLEQVDQILDGLPFGACREVQYADGSLVEEYIPF